MSKTNQKTGESKPKPRSKASAQTAVKSSAAEKNSKPKTKNAEKESAPKAVKKDTDFQGKIALVGFMGAGKTTLAERMSQETGAPCVDLDEYISALESREISQIINNLGEEIFREIETAALEEVSILPSPKIYALGGGTFLSASNREILARAGIKSVWVDVPFEVCWERIIGEGDQRPLAKTKDSAEKLFAERREIYQLADVHIALDKADTEKNVKKLIKQIFDKKTKAASDKTAKKESVKETAKTPANRKNAKRK